MFFRRKPAITETPPVLVPASAVTVAEDDYELVNAVVQYVKTMLNEGCYLEEELNPEAVSAYWVDFYVGEVLQGGHHRYLRTTGMERDMMGRVQHGLDSMGAAPFDRIHRAMTTWITKNKAFDRGLSFVAEHAEAVDKLDRAFENSGGSMEVARAAAAWIRTFDDLRVMRFDEYKRAMSALWRDNPNAGARRFEREVERLSASLSDPLEAGIGIILGRVHDGEYRNFVVEDGTPVSRDADSMMLWDVTSDHGRFQAVDMEDRIAVFRKTGDSAKIGIGNLQRDKIQIAIDLAERYHIALASVLLTDALDDPAPIETVIFEGREGHPVRARFRIIRHDAPDLALLTSKRRVSLIDPKDDGEFAYITLRKLEKEAAAFEKRRASQGH